MFCSQSGNNTSQYETEECGVNVYKDFDMGLHRTAPKYHVCSEGRETGVIISS